MNEHDPWERLLTQLPAEPCPPQLVGTVITRVTWARRRAVWAARGRDGALFLLAAAGVRLIAPHAASAIEYTSSLSASTALAWLESAVQAPLSALSGLAFEMQAMGGEFETALVAALTLLAVPALFSLHALLGQQPYAKGAER